MAIIEPIKICFVSLNGYPLFQKNSTGHFGGAELQMSLIIKELLKDKSFEVTLITGDFGQANVVKKHNLKIYKCFRKIRFSYFELIRTALIAKKINADFYVARTASNLLYLIAKFCRLFNKKLVYMVAHDWDCQTKVYNRLTHVNRKLFYQGLNMADIIIAQTETQQKMLQANFRLKSIVMPSLSIPGKSLVQKSNQFILWVGRADYWKRPLAFITLARALPKHKFVMICRQGNDLRLYTKVKKLAHVQANLAFYPSVSIEQSKQFFQNAKILVNTSLAEGFPNTFIQAGLARTPVVSLVVNPDNYLHRFNCGFAAGNNQKQMLFYCRKILANSDLAATLGGNNFRYVKSNHSAKNINIFKSTLNEKIHS
jgi:glycosyltransferase involved in cell wall biosynthesis